MAHNEPGPGQAPVDSVIRGGLRSAATASLDAEDTSCVAKMEGDPGV